MRTSNVVSGSSLTGRLGEPYDIAVTQGQDATTVLTLSVSERGYSTAAIVMTSGVAQTLSLFTGRPTADPDRPATFSGPHTIECPAVAVTGTGAIGVDPECDELSLHAHVIFCDARGRLRGCHMARGECIAGEGGLTFSVFPARDAGYLRMLDDLTGFKLFFPKGTGHGE